MARFKVAAKAPKAREEEALGIKKAPIPAPRRLYCRAIRVPERPLLSTGNDKTLDPATTAPKRFQIRSQPRIPEAVGETAGVLLEVWYHKKNTIRYYTIPPGQLSPEELNLLQQHWAGDDFDFWCYAEAEVLDSRIAARLEPAHMKKTNDLARRTQHLAMRLGLIAGRDGVAEDLRRYEQRGGVMEPCSIELPVRCQLIRVLISE